MHGYVIAREIETISQNALSLGEGALYPALKSLEREEAIVSEWRIQRSSPSKKVYTITDHGQQKLKRQIAGWSAFTNGVSAVLGAAVQTKKRGNPIQIPKTAPG
jgi:DNA-binding PadR family transcriptional regulator